MAGSEPVQRSAAKLPDQTQVDAMSMEILGFLVVAASLVLIGFASGPMVVRKAHVPTRAQRSHPYR
jgi:hypothetical protein